MMRVFIGYDPSETVAFHVLSHSLMRHASEPLSITPVVLRQLPVTRERHPLQSTEFSFSRFLVPWLCGFEGRALFMDCDMLCRSDIAELWHKDFDATVAVVKHDYIPKTQSKFLGNVQSRYARKNWSSLMLFDNERCRALTPETVNRETGLFLHQFHWAEDVWELDPAWNHLVGEYDYREDAKLVHFTLGTPCFPEYAGCDYAQEWREERNRMLQCEQRSARMAA